MISLPMEYLFAFKFGLNLIGLWLGQMCGSLCHVLSTQYLISIHYDWEEVAQEVKVRNELDAARVDLISKQVEMV